MVLVFLGGVLASEAVRSTLRIMADINITAAPEKWFPATVVGTDYRVKAPKKALALALMMRLKNAGENPELMGQAIDVMTAKMFGKEVAPSIKDRLNDEDDDLDIDHLMALMNALIEKVSGDPTT